ncbi:MAG: translation initiation factor IF-2 N-terminal domain-containing protein, partial [Bacteriovoracaceae bacterium]|nr:translation initiation factor IF-2 N-terminal domain-containing protein [Bacteriovoracaceae bacterium]
MKVFELAKELDIGAIDLVDKLKSIGMTVRNHMVALTDEEVVKARAALAPAPVVASKTVKKVTRKAVKKDDSEATEAQVKVADEKASTKSVTVKRKSKILKKADEADETVEETKEEQPVVVKAPEREVVQKDYLDAKSSLHTFTPVYVPEDVPAKSDKTTLYRATQSTAAGTDDAVEPGVDSEAMSDDDKSKKRFGAMATAVSKKATANRSQEITLLRAEEEMKLASSYVGTQIYSPAKKKKIFNGITRQTEITEVKDSKRVVVIHDVVTANELAQKLSQKFESLQNKALEINLLLSEDDYLGVGLATDLANLYNFRV